MKQTAVEWLEEQIKWRTNISDIIIQAKEMEKEQAERMYSEDEVVDLIEDWTKMAKGLNMNFPSDKFEKWFEQFKKK